MEPIVIATGNPHKIAELRAIFAEAGIPVIGLRDVPGCEALPEPEEHGSTFEENAVIKARAYTRLTGRTCLADDSGLEVDALSGAPGVISSHYATGGRETGLAREERDRRNNEKLLKELEGVPAEARTARFVCVMALASPGGARDASRLTTVRGTFEGRIGLPGDVPRGAHGFGYDPLFLAAPGCTRTSAELEPAEKNRLSHRGAAARAMASALRASSPGRR